MSDLRSPAVATSNGDESLLASHGYQLAQGLAGRQFRRLRQTLPLL